MHNKKFISNNCIETTHGSKNYTILQSTFAIFTRKISFTDDEYIIATQLSEPSYISLLSALNFHGLVQQIPKNIQCINPMNTRTYNALGIEYHKISRKLFFGYKAYKKGDNYIFVADKEKALTDGLYLGQIDESLLKEIIKQLDIKMLLKYSRKFSKKVQKLVKETSKQ